MVFSSAVFLFFFLPAAILAYRVTPRSLRNGLLCVASLLFYAWGAGAFVLGLLASIGLNYLVGLRLERAHDAGDTRTAARWLRVGVVANVALLAVFKYANFTVGTIDGILVPLGVTPPPWAAIPLPIGISFFTFHALSYLIDINRGTARHLLSPIDFALYIAFFPQLIAGPIIRFHEIREQIVDRHERLDAFATGVFRFALGLGKKVLVADLVAPIADAAFGVPSAQLSTATVVLGVAAYTVQLYFDFSGYSDMAIGLGMLFGFRFPENFARPYASRSVTEFWRRWHMSLSRWFRDYLYIPLGGNRGTPLATYRNLVIVFVVTGLWHGANWTFLAWGLYHGGLLLIERVAGVGRTEGDRSIWWRPVTTLLVMGGWILFRSPNLQHAAGMVLALAHPHGAIPAAVAIAAQPLALAALVFGLGSLALPRDWVTGLRLEAAPSRTRAALRLGLAGVVLPVAFVLTLAGTFSPFLYFQF